MNQSLLLENYYQSITFDSEIDEITTILDEIRNYFCKSNSNNLVKLDPLR